MKRLFFLLLLLAPILVFAQPDDRDAPPPPRGKDWNEQLETVLIARLTRMLELKPDQAKTFFPYLNEFQEKNRKIRHDHMELMTKLRKLGDPGSKTTMIDIESAIKELDENQKQQVQSVNIFIKSVSTVLEPWQIARLQIFIIRFPERVEELIRERQGGNRFRGGRDGRFDHDKEEER